MISDELIKKVDRLPKESYEMVELFVEQIYNLETKVKKEAAFQKFMDKMETAEKSIVTEGEVSEEEVERELAKI